MNTALVGYTGFVGGNLAAAHPFDAVYNSKNIEEGFGRQHDLLVYAGLRAEKYLANTDPEADMALVRQAMENIRRLAPKSLVLISTVDVYRDPAGKDESSPIETQGLHPYGLNRYRLEEWVQEHVEDHLILRLPGLFGKGLKKNFLFDMKTLIPTMLTQERYQETQARSAFAAGCYQPGQNGFYKLRPLSEEEHDRLRAFFEGNDFNALAFTDSRSVYQFYGLSRLWQDILAARRAGIRLLNMATEPVSAAEVYQAVTGQPFCNQLDRPPVFYDFRTLHAQELGGKGGYLADKQAVLEQIKEFMRHG